MSKVVIAIVGLCGTGKTEATKYVQGTFNCQTVYFGGYVLQETVRRGLEINSDNERNVRENLRDVHGMDAIAKLAYPDILTIISTNQILIIDGLYSYSELLYLRESIEYPLQLIAIHSSRNVRYHRLALRSIRPMTKEEVEQRDFFEINNLEKSQPITLADYHIVNDTDMDCLYNKLELVCNEIRNIFLT